MPKGMPGYEPHSHHGLLEILRTSVRCKRRPIVRVGRSWVQQHFLRGLADGIGNGLARQRIVIEVLYESSGFGGVHCPPARAHVGPTRRAKNVGNAVESARSAAAGRGA